MPFRNTFSRVFGLEVAIAAVVFGVVLLTVGGALLHGRFRRGRSSQRHENTPLELGVVLLLIGVAGYLAWNSIDANGQETSDRRPEVVVRVTAFQWCWRFTYPGTNVSVTGTCGPDGSVPTLVVPTNETVEVDVTSADVVHEFWIPSLDYKVEAMPDHTNQFEMRLTSTGRWAGRCSEYCGLYHAFMAFFLRAVTPANYQRWLSSAGAPAIG